MFFHIKQAPYLYASVIVTVHKFSPTSIRASHLFDFIEKELSEKSFNCRAICPI